MTNILWPTAHLFLPFPLPEQLNSNSLYLFGLSKDTYTKYQQFFSLPSMSLSKSHVFHFSSDKCELFYNSLTLRISVRRAHRFLPGTTHQFVRMSYYSDYAAVLGPSLTCHVLSEALGFRPDEHQTMHCWTKAFLLVRFTGDPGQITPSKASEADL